MTHLVDCLRARSSKCDAREHGQLPLEHSPGPFLYSFLWDLWSMAPLRQSGQNCCTFANSKLRLPARCSVIQHQHQHRTAWSMKQIALACGSSDSSCTWTLHPAVPCADPQFPSTRAMAKNLETASACLKNLKDPQLPNPKPLKPRVVRPGARSLSLSLRSTRCTVELFSGSLARC